MPAPGLFDSHCHFDFPRFDGVRESEWLKARAEGVRGLVVPGVRRADWSRVQSLAKPQSGVWYCLGIHPWFIDEHNWADLDALEEMLTPPPPGCLAVGECGLDALRGDLRDQKYWFRAQVTIASRCNLPLVIHSVKAHDQVHALLRQQRWLGRALVHGFSGSYQQAKKLVDLGCYIGVGGVITFDRAKKTRDTIGRLPVESLVLETDAPDMSPVGVARGKNSPACLPQIFQALCDLRQAHPQRLAEQLLANAAALYGVQSGELAPEQ